MDILSVLETFGVPITMCFAFGYFIWRQNKWIQEDLKKDLEEQSKRLEDIVIGLINAQKKLQTYMNHPSFVKEINTMEDFLRAPWEATANMAPQIFAAIFTRGASMYFQESGLNYIEQIDNIINEYE